MGLYSAIVTGLYRRERTGEGCYVTTSLIAEGIWSSAVLVQAALCDAKFYPLHDRKNPPNAIFNVYQTSDNRWFLIVMQPKDWPALPPAIGQSGTRCPILDLPMTPLEQRTQRSSRRFWIRSSPRNPWHTGTTFSNALASLTESSRPQADVTTDPQVLANEIIVPIEGGGEHLTRTVSSPIKIHGVPKAKARRAPELGEHNDEVLRELGFSADQIEGFRASATIPQASHDAQRSLEVSDE